MGDLPMCGGEWWSGVFLCYFLASGESLKFVVWAVLPGSGSLGFASPPPTPQSCSVKQSFHMDAGS